MSVRDHCSKLEDVNCLAVLPDTLLLKEWLTRRINADCRACSRHRNSQHQTHSRAKHDVKGPLCGKVADAALLGSGRVGMRGGSPIRPSRYKMLCAI